LHHRRRMQCSTSSITTPRETGDACGVGVAENVSTAEAADSGTAAYFAGVLRRYWDGRKKIVGTVRGGGRRRAPCSVKTYRVVVEAAAG